MNIPQINKLQMELFSKVFFYGSIILSLFYIFFVMFPAHLNHDVSWILYGANELLKGGEFGQDITDINPPLAWWIFFPPAFIAELLSLSPILVLRLYIFALLTLSLALFWYTNPKIPFWKIMIMAVILIVTPGYDFAQREHLMVILALPYLGIVLPKDSTVSSPMIKIIIGVLAGIGFCIKPYFLFIPVIIESIILFQTKSIKQCFRYETISMFVVGLVYIAMVLLITPLYFQEIIPTILPKYQNYSNIPLLFMPFFIFYGASAIFVALIILFIAKVQWENRSKIFFAAMIGAMISAIIQQKGWSYHILPAIIFALFAILFAKITKKTERIYLLGLFLAGVAVIKQPILQFNDLLAKQGERHIVRILGQKIRSLPQKGKIFSFSASPRVVMSALVEGKGHWVNTCCVFFLNNAIWDKKNDPKIQSSADTDLSVIMKKLREDEPDMLIVQTKGINYLSYLKNKSQFMTFLSYYKKGYSIHYIRGNKKSQFRIFERKL